jgi:hypothetical protein
MEPPKRNDNGDRTDAKKMASSTVHTYRAKAGNSLPPTYGNRNIIQTKPKHNMRQMAISTTILMALMPLRIVNWLMSLVCNLMAVVIESVITIIITWVAIAITILLLIGTFLWIVSL